MLEEGIGEHHNSADFSLLHRNNNIINVHFLLL